MPELSIFVSHTREQTATVRRLAAELTSRGFSIAINRLSVPPGKRVQPALERSMAEAARCIVCFSAKPGGPAEYDAADLVLANERMRAKPEDTSWLIPVTLTACELPAIDFGNGLLKGLPAIELHADWDGEIEKLIAALPRPATGLPAETVPSTPLPGGHSEMSTQIRTAQGKEFTFTNVHGAAGTNATSRHEIDSLTSDGPVNFTNVKR
ncbi:MAG: hypothetical protein QOI58_1657 [Thermoanaerobaculia bacterium]|jgi:hypothetical protein|nr:hypothetical protein [Thermoanaerobaculia bacterium]